MKAENSVSRLKVELQKLQVRQTFSILSETKLARLMQCFLFFISCIHLAENAEKVFGKKRLVNLKNKNTKTEQKNVCKGNWTDLLPVTFKEDQIFFCFTASFRSGLPFGARGNVRLAVICCSV